MNPEQSTPLLEGPEGALVPASTHHALARHKSSVPGQVLQRFAQLFMLQCLTSTVALAIAQFFLTGTSAGLQYYIWIPALAAMFSFLWAIPMGAFCVGMQWFRTRDVDHDAPVERLETQHFKTVTIPLDPATPLEPKIRMALSSLEDVTFLDESSSRTIKVHHKRKRRFNYGGMEVGVRIVRTTATHAELLVWSMYRRQTVVFDGGNARRVLNKLIAALSGKSPRLALPEQ
jgi:hypothetical protein